tara:strand:+ start:383 stop:529 length:147 start_codon:yes stop_codon:yes gene_type:complete
MKSLKEKRTDVLVMRLTPSLKRRLKQLAKVKTKGNVAKLLLSYVPDEE